jgi:hypothetical protein
MTASMSAMDLDAPVSIASQFGQENPGAKRVDFFFAGEFC